MKKVFLAIMALAIAVGCAKVTPEQANVVNSAKQEISFSTFDNFATKAVVDGTTFPSDGQFSVFADWNNADLKEANYINGAAFDNNGDPVTGHYYWPEADGVNTLDFYAIYPADTYTRTSDTANITVDCEKTNAASVDIMFATKTGQKYESGASTHKVALSFEHQLSYVIFQAKATDIAVFTSLKIKEIKVTVPYANGSIAFKSNSDCTLTPSGSAYTYTVNAGDVTLSGSYTTCGYFIAIPQAVNAAGAKASVKYEYVVGGKTYTKTVSDITLNNTKAGASFDSWEKGKKYTYNISIGIKEILFTPSVSGWTTGGSKDLI